MVYMPGTGTHYIIVLNPCRVTNRLSAVSEPSSGGERRRFLALCAHSKWLAVAAKVVVHRCKLDDPGA